jgi:hypothetical protein
MNLRYFSVFSVPTVIFCVLFALIYLAVKTGLPWEIGLSMSIVNQSMGGVLAI